MFEIEVIDEELRGLVHAGAAVIDHRKEGAVVGADTQFLSPSGPPRVCCRPNRGHVQEPRVTLCIGGVAPTPISCMGRMRGKNESPDSI